MARSHHRKKHKQNLRNYQHSRDVTVKKSKAKVTGLFTVIGTFLGIGIGYFATGAALPMIIAAVAGTAIGYYIGKKMDESA
jgi:outer membrane lipoprotein SlyB